MRMSSSRRAAIGALFLSACSGTEAGGDSDSGGNSGGLETEDSASGDPSESGDGDGDPDSASSGADVPPAWEPTLARGIGVQSVEANQGVVIPIGEAGQWVGAEGRTAPIVAARPIVVRALWTLADDWTPREIEGRLRVRLPDGSEETYSDAKTVEGESNPRDFGQTFSWLIPAEFAVPVAEYRVELYETDPGHEDASEAGVAATTPTDGFGLIGVEDSYQVLKVVLVPFNYNVGNCDAQPDTSDETMAMFRDMMFQVNPIQRLDFELHAPIQWNETLRSFDELNAHLSDLRFEEGAPPETYYYGLIDVCAFDVGGFGGEANGIPKDATPENAWMRVSSGLSLEPDWSAELFVHEVGHSQGRRHVECTGDEGAPDLRYPIPGGKIGQWGMGVIDFNLRHPTVYGDYMSYCHPAWVSAWGINQVFPVIRELSRWETEGREPDSNRVADRVLVGSVYPWGETRWRVYPGRPPQGSSTGAGVATFSTGTGSSARVGATVTPSPEGSLIHVHASVPNGIGAIDGVQIETEDLTVHVPWAQVAVTATRAN